MVWLYLSAIARLGGWLLVTTNLDGCMGCTSESVMRLQYSQQHRVPYPTFLFEYGTLREFKNSSTGIWSACGHPFSVVVCSFPYFAFCSCREPTHETLVLKGQPPKLNCLWIEIEHFHLCLFMKRFVKFHFPWMMQHCIQSLYKIRKVVEY